MDRERWRLALAQHVEVGRNNLDVAGRQVRVLVAGLAHLDGAGDLDAPLAAQRVRGLHVAEDDLDHAAAVAQVDERDAAVVAPRRNPAGQHHLGACVVTAQVARHVRADHEDSSAVLTVGRRSSAGGAQVSGAAGAWSPERMSLTS